MKRLRASVTLLPQLMLNVSWIAIVRQPCFIQAATVTFGNEKQNTGNSQQQQSQCTGASSPNHDNENLSATVSRRVGQLDHWDSTTLACYFGIDLQTGKALPVDQQVRKAAEEVSRRTLLSTGGESTSGIMQPYDRYMGYDAAVLFYAQWCPNCHAFAPLYDQIANLIKAGTRQSNVIMALFDCEKDVTHQRLCTTAGVTHYPTIMFVGAGPYHENIGRKEKKERKNIPPLRRVVKFRGNWQYGEQVMDWIRVCHGLSSWYKLSRENFLMKFLRSIFTLSFLGGRSGDFGPGRRGKIPKDMSLPIGVPDVAGPTGIASQWSTSGAGRSSGTAPLGGSGLEVSKLKSKLEATEKMRKDMEMAATHSALLIDKLLFPGQSVLSDFRAGNTSSTDPGFEDTFVEIGARGAWDDYDANISNIILRSCMADLALDYCSRLTTQAVKDESILAYFAKNTSATVADFEKKLVNDLNETEPYCFIIESCILTDFKSEECKPKKCPFKNDIGCRYVSACLDQTVANEYKTLLGTVDDVKYGSTVASTATKPTGSKVGWGVAS